MTDRRMTTTDIVTRAINDGRVESISIGPRAVCVTVRGDGRYNLSMSSARASMLLDTVGVALRREEADRSAEERRAG